MKPEEFEMKLKEAGNVLCERIEEAAKEWANDLAALCESAIETSKGDEENEQYVRMVLAELQTITKRVFEMESFKQ